VAGGARTGRTTRAAGLHAYNPSTSRVRRRRQRREALKELMTKGRKFRVSRDCAGALKAALRIQR
jgi:hypothetical protein